MRVPIRNVFGRLLLSPTLASNELVNSHPHPETLLHLGFGQSPFPVHKSLRQTNAGFAENHYENTAGSARLISAAREFYERQHGFDLSNHDVIMCPGSKLGLFAMQLVVEGSTMLPIPSWVSYEPQMKMLGIPAVKFYADLSDEGMYFDPEKMQRAYDDAIAKGLPRPTKMIINSPNNPTGLTICNRDDVAKFVVDNDIVLLSDEIYDGVTANGEWTSFLPLAPDNTVITSGLSKAFSLGGWRVGCLIVPKSMEGLAHYLRVVASETWSAVASPVQTACLQAYNADNRELMQYIKDCGDIYHHIGTWFSDILKAGGINCPRHQGAFYLYPNFDAFRKQLAQLSIETSEDLAKHLVTELGIVTLPATAFGDEQTLSLRLALCAFDGQALVDAYVQNGRKLSTQQLEHLAPSLFMAATRLHDFATSLQLK